MSEQRTRISHYRLVEQIGRGGMGEVYRAIDENLEREVAIKVLPKSLADSQEGRARLVREARSAGSLNHPSIVTVHHVGEWDGRVYLVMELVEGRPLTEFVGSALPARAAAMVAQAADALAYAHERDILHRDIKCENLMLTSGGIVKVLDFGLAKATSADADNTDASDQPNEREPRPSASPDEIAATVHAGTELELQSTTPIWPVEPVAKPGDAIGDSAELAATVATPSAPGGSDSLSSLDSSASRDQLLTVAGHLLGTPAYMSPEIATGKPPTPRTDIYSLGIVLYELLAGKRPYDQGTIAGTLKASLAGGAEPPSAAAGGDRAVQKFDDVCMRAIATRQSERFETMREFASALRAAEQTRANRAWPVVAGIAAVLGIIAIVAVSQSGGNESAGSAAVADAGTAIAVRVDSVKRLTFDSGCEEHPSHVPGKPIVIYDGVVDGDYELLSLNTDTGQRTRLTHSPGWDYSASVSPGGDMIAYVHMSEAGRHLRVLPIDGDRAEAPRTLVATVSYPSWADAEHIFAGDDSGRLLRVHARTGKQTLVRRSNTAAQLRLNASPTPEDFFTVWFLPSDPERRTFGRFETSGELTALQTNVVDTLTIGPTGTLVYFTHVEASMAGALTARTVAPPHTEVELPTRMDARSGVTITPDAKQLVYSDCWQRVNVVRLVRGSEVETVLGRGIWEDQRPQPFDATRIMFSSDRGGPTKVWLGDLTTGKFEPVTDGTTYNGAASFGQSHVVYVERRPDRAGLWMRPIDGGEPTRITSDKSDVDAQFTVDGKHVVFSRTLPGVGSRVFIADISSGSAKPLADPGSNSPTVSPDGKRFAYVQSEPDGHRMYTAKLDGTDRRRLSKVPTGNYRAPQYSKKGDRLLVIRSLKDLVEVDPTDRKAPTLLWSNKLYGLGGAVEAPDGNGYIGTVAAFDGDLWLATGYFP